MISNTEIRSPILAALLVLVVLWAVFVRGLTAEDLPQPQQLMQAANEISSLSKIRPYILTATVVLQPGTKNQKSGKLTIYRGQGSYRSELEIGSYRQLEWTQNGKLRIARSTSYPLPGLRNITEIDRFLDLRFPPETAFSKVSKKTLNGIAAFCFDAREPENINVVRECFDAIKKTAIQSAVRTRAPSGIGAWFSDYREIDGQLFPGNVRFSPNQHDTQLEVRDIQVKRNQFNIADLPVSKEFLEFDTCEDMQPGRLVKRVDPSYPSMAKIAHINGDVIVYSILAKDGSLQGLKILDSSHPILSEAAMEAVKQWRYAPPMCASVPVSVENEVAVRFYMK